MYVIDENDIHTLDGAYAHLCQKTGLGGRELSLICTMWQGAKEAEALRAENAKLREVVERLVEAIDTIKTKAGSHTVACKPDPDHPGFTGIYAVAEAALADAMLAEREKAAPKDGP